ncbi:capsular polysaccharide transport system permease protein [Roseivivax halotolerans]|uniref:Capsular polysaccharide transport system permease protein n=1 Tax=Roseivivax halotolerans TaxID=93684 RepID=A0A1I5Z0E7_9RHOB|nr:capsule biosynthesis protein [Roseivivax halotolerans]SFQ49963.1 capsular polysaccharide transport system permease protein [Roseivivax halotolerans]
MTTKPKAKKFRIRRNEGSAQPAPEAAQGREDTPPSAQPETRMSAPPQSSEQRATAPREDASRQTEASSAPQPRSGEVSSAGQVAGETDMQKIRQEGLTGRQLRMARRMAQKHGLAPTSDFDAVRLLRAKGIDPFQRANMLELVVGRDESDGQSTGEPGLPTRANPVDPARVGDGVKLPQTIPLKKQQVPSTETMSTAERRAMEVAKVQRELGKRRRRRFALMMARLAFFVMLPTLIAGYYFYAVATPMYATKSEFLILKNDGGGGGSGGMGGLLSGTQFATNQDAIAVQSYLSSKDAMLRLDQDVGFREHFMQDDIDPIQRLDADASMEDTYKVYKRNVEIGYDPTEGVVRMEVRAADPLLAKQFSEALIDYAEERVDNLTQRKRETAVVDAEEGLAEAEEKRVDAQEMLVRLQQENALLDPEAKIASLRSQISSLEVQLQEKQLQRQALLDNPRPNQSRVEGVEGDIRRINNMLGQLNERMTTETTGDGNLAEIAIRTQLAQADLATRDLMLQSALERLESARREADSQARYLTTSVVPVASEDPSYPRSFENTILAFLIFAGIYLMISLTASILREQVSS